MKTSIFVQDLMYVINKHGKENDSNTPDFILAGYLEACLEAFNRATNKRNKD